MKIVVITSHTHDDWDGGGDCVITEGLKVLLPEMLKHKLVYNPEIPPDRIPAVVKSADYVISAGTPAWANAHCRSYWPPAIQYGKPMAFLGIGLAYPNQGAMWYGVDGPLGLEPEIRNLQRFGQLDAIVCRDKLCFHRLQQLEFRPLTTLPCPAFYALPPRLVQRKKEVVISIPNPHETSRSTPTALKNFIEKTRKLITGLQRYQGVNVHVIYQRTSTGIARYGGGSKERYRKFMRVMSASLGKPVKNFRTFKAFSDFLADKDVYIGVRNHGAMPCAGSGMPSLLLGTDYRQFLADEVPFVSRIDISHAGWEPVEVMRWYDSVDPSGVSMSLNHFREQSWNSWQFELNRVREKLA